MNSNRITMTRNFAALLLFIACLANSEPSPGGTVILTYGDFSRFVKFNDMEYKLEWGKNNVRNISFSTFDTADILHCTLVTETGEFTVLKIGEGAGGKKSIILPLTRTSREIQYHNAICVDLETTTIILENPSEDSALIIENFINKKKIAVGKGLVPCQSGFPHDCIDSLVFYKNNLSFYWITPDKHHKEKKIEFKKFKINLK
jgi:hypothetical protein